MDHAGYRRLAAGAVLEDLDRDEAAAFARHVARCVPCRILGDELRAAAADLAIVVRQRRPPPSLLASVTSALHSVDTPHHGPPGDQTPSP